MKEWICGVTEESSREWQFIAKQELVRCKDCIFYNSLMGHCKDGRSYPSPDWFCADGRKHDDT